MEKRKLVAYGNVLNLQEMADALDVDTNTLRKYVKKGCPYLRQAKRGKGIEWKFDSHIVLSWVLNYRVLCSIDKIRDPRLKETRLLEPGVSHV